MPIKPRRLHRRHAQFLKLETEPALNPLDYCTMVQDSKLSDSELAERLGVETRLVQRMRDLDYMPKDKGLQAKILDLYLEE